MAPNLLSLGINAMKDLGPFLTITITICLFVFIVLALYGCLCFKCSQIQCQKNTPCVVLQGDKLHNHLKGLLDGD